MSRNSKLETQNLRLETRFLILKSMEDWVSSFESILPTYLWPVLYLQLSNFSTKAFKLVPLSQSDHFSWQVSKSHQNLHSQVHGKNPKHTCAPKGKAKKVIWRKLLSSLAVSSFSAHVKVQNDKNANSTKFGIQLKVKCTYDDICNTYSLCCNDVLLVFFVKPCHSLKRKKLHLILFYFFNFKIELGFLVCIYTFLLHGTFFKWITRHTK